MHELRDACFVQDLSLLLRQIAYQIIILAGCITVNIGGPLFYIEFQICIHKLMIAQVHLSYCRQHISSGKMKLIFAFMEAFLNT